MNTAIKKGSTFLPAQWVSYLYVNKAERGGVGKKKRRPFLSGGAAVIYVRTEDSEATHFAFQRRKKKEGGEEEVKEDEKENEKEKEEKEEVEAMLFLLVLLSRDGNRPSFLHYLPFRKITHERNRVTIESSISTIRGENFKSFNESSIVI
uniref:Uncharacterized protein n=1 Tax=Vespula pensylvanica TaxID=30213 RepID=A0A834P649_VESPE|nr:hypothetical protein H0235_006035 [Vespula pensylvanica]